MKRGILIWVLWIVAGASFAQRSAILTQDNGDCTGAIAIAGIEYHQSQAVRGFGNKLEIKENTREHHQWFEREHHTTWYKFRVPHSTTLTFDIIPENIEDDIDFLLFEGNVPGICDKIATKQVTPVRSNISRNNKDILSMCGLSKDASDKFVRSGVGSSYSSAMEVEAGALFYLVIDHQERPRAGYTIRFNYDPPPPEPEVEQKIKQTQKLLISIVDHATGAPLTANLTIDGMRFDEVVEAKDSSSYSFEMEMYRNLRIGCVRKGYMFHSQKVKGSVDAELKVELRLKPITPGEQVILDDIRFVGNETKVMRQSDASMMMLLHFMEANPTVRIEVQGHVNGPTYKNTKEFIELSTSRARTVYQFLLVNDIEPKRMTFVGYGNSAMLFPEPKTKEQSEANRRVEIKVLGT